MSDKSTAVIANVALATLLTVTGCSDKSTTSEGKISSSSASILIEPGVRVGAVRKGMRPEDVTAKMGMADKTVGKVSFYYALGFSLSYASDGTVRKVYCGKIPGVDEPLAKPFEGRTKEGIGIGSTRAEIIKVFGKPLVGKTANPTEERLAYSTTGLLFILLDDKVCQITVDLHKAP